jgi:hypothetical protein
MKTLIRAFNIAGVGLFLGVFTAICSQPEQPVTAAPKAVLQPVRREPWSPTYRAAREAGFEPASSQKLSDLCKQAEASGVARYALNACITPEDTAQGIQGEKIKLMAVVLIAASKENE